MKKFSGIGGDAECDAKKINETANSMCKIKADGIRRT